MRNFRNFACLPNSPNLEYFEKYGNFPFPPCILSFLEVHCHPNFPIRGRTQRANQAKPTQKVKAPTARTAPLVARE